MRILMLSSEVSPFAKTGGLADVVGALPRQLASRGHDVRIMMPLYRNIDRYKYRLIPLLPQLTVNYGSETIDGQVMRCSFPGDARIPVYFIQQDFLFSRTGFYGEANRDYDDNDRRFAFLNMIALWTLKALDWPPDIIHLHDWQAGLVAPLLRYHPAITADPFYRRMRTVFTIHNLAYQGLFDKSLLPKVQLPWHVFTSDGLEFHGRASFLKAGIVYSDRVTTVSPSYAREIQTEEFGAGMDGVLRARSSHLYGILNGIDNTVWDPETDPHIPGHYARGSLAGKQECKNALIDEFNLKGGTDKPLIGCISRLVDQKGFDLVQQIMPALLSLGARFVVLGTGAAEYEEYFRDLAREHPGRVGAAITYDERLAHLIEAGADIFLMPSRFEPSGLNQLYSMRYGTLPVVRRVGGLADSVVDATPEAITDGTATGFVFDKYEAGELLDAAERAVSLYHGHNGTWKRLVRNAMARDSSWEKAAAEYERVFELAREL